MRITLKATNITHTNAIDAYVAKRMHELEKVLEAKEQSEIARIDVGATNKIGRASCRERVYSSV